MENKKNINELTDNKELWELSKPTENILFKSKTLLISNLANKMSETQNILFSLCLLHVQVENNVAKAEFNISEIINLTNSGQYESYNPKRITKDRTVVSASNINLVLDNKSKDGRTLIGETIQLFNKIHYKNGVYTAYFNTNVDENGESPILNLLKSKEQNPLVYNIKTFAKLGSAGQCLYEHLLMATSQNKREIILSVDDLISIFKVSTNSSQFGSINARQLQPAIDSINENTELDIKVNYIKSGRAVTHVSLIWRVDKVELPPTDKQIILMKELYVKLSKLDLVSGDAFELLSQLKEGHLISRNKAGIIISEALKIVSEFEKIHQEALQSIPEIRERYSDFFSNNFPNIVPKMRNDILTVIQEFPDSEREGLLDYAYHLYTQNKAKSPNYIKEVLTRWALAGVRDVADAREVHDDNYGDTYELVPKDVEISPEFKNAMDLWKE